MDVADTTEDTTGAGAGDTMVTVTIQETYDLQTVVNKMGLLSIHTPSYDLIHKLYPGLCMNYKYIHVDKCDFAVACASVLPADPLQVGVESGDIAPQDMFNPILYRAVSTDSFNTIFNRCYYVGDNLNSIGSLGDSGSQGSAAFPDSTVNNETMYYGLLQESGWKKAMPQSGFGMRGLVPLVYDMVSTFGNAATPSNSYTEVTVITSAGAAQPETNHARLFRGSARPMPRIPTAYGPSSVVSNDIALPSSTYTTSIPKVTVACVIVPPAKLHTLFYRMTIRWSLTFSEPISMVERATLSSMASLGYNTYGSNLIASTSKAPEDADYSSTADMVDTVDVNSNMVMQG